MKINGPNHSNFNPYQKQMNKQMEPKKSSGQQDRLEISKQALNMQGNEKTHPSRQKKIDQIKHDIDTGNYQVNAKATAKKMLDFWSNKS
ncbi:flagellar biosynthesis anti-sigma factor FlgM [Halobacillus rhizosphaerae]|uniref:flagellar biosynthesis anti-sigma factor FlgM n=1 Tax=Halobacillus rhizosphaerae TaxID=3064889 RepID=UPI00398B683C